MVCLKDMLLGLWRSKGSYVCKDCRQEFKGVPNQWERCPECTEKLQKRLDAAKGRLGAVRPA